VLESSVIDRIRELIAAQIEPRQRSLHSALQGATRMLAAGGMTGSGNAAHRYGEIASDELKVRAHIIWSAIQRSHVSMNGHLEGTTLQDLQQQLAEHINAQASRVRVATTSFSKNLPRADMLNAQIEVTISTITRDLLRQMNVEAQFYVDRLGQPAAQSGTASITINGNVAAVQTGMYATAHISLTGHDRDRLVEALQELRQALAQNAEASVEQREQGTELVADVITAVTAEKPNAPKIAGLLGGLATTVQTVASLRGAWEFVRDAAIAAGLLGP
jgi:hypothetical protein